MILPNQSHCSKGNACLLSLLIHSSYNTWKKIWSSVIWQLFHPLSHHVRSLLVQCADKRNRSQYCYKTLGKALFKIWNAALDLRIFSWQRLYFKWSFGHSDSHYTLFIDLRIVIWIRILRKCKCTTMLPNLRQCSLLCFNRATKAELLTLFWVQLQPMAITGM